MFLRVIPYATIFGRQVSAMFVKTLFSHTYTLMKTSEVCAIFQVHYQHCPVVKQKHLMRRILIAAWAVY